MRSSNDLGSEPSTSGRGDDIDARLAQAKSDLQRQWAALRAGTLSSTGPGRPDGASSLPERLLQLVTGQALVTGRGKRREGQPMQQQRQRQEGRQRAEPLNGLPAMELAGTTEGAAGEQQQQQQGQQTGQQQQQQQEDEDGQQEVWLTATYMLMMATWLAFLAQWWTLLPDLAAACLGGKAMLVMPQFMIMYPDTAVTHMLQLVSGMDVL